MPDVTTPASTSRRIGAALSAGAIAIVANTVVLKAADFVHIDTAKGGILRLIAPWFAPLLNKIGVASAWNAAGGPSPQAPSFQIGFHLAIGLLMAMLYGIAFEPILPGRAWIKGSLYAIAVWILNAAVVLPVTDEGFAGAAHLTVTGMVWFAAAHTVFFLLLAVLFDRYYPCAAARKKIL